MTKKSLESLKSNDNKHEQETPETGNAIESAEHNNDYNNKVSPSKD